jgi:hypothetical protein
MTSNAHDEGAKLQARNVVAGIPVTASFAFEQPFQYPQVRGHG